MIKQYVNLPNKPADHHGHRVKLEVDTQQLNENKIAVTEWWVEATGADHVDQKYLSRIHRSRMVRKQAINRRDKFRNTLILTHAGGDQYTVKCSKKGDRSNPVELEEIETWRKIYYTIHYMNAKCLTTFNAVKSKFEAAFKDQAFIELHKEGQLQTRKDEPRTKSTNALTHLYRKLPALTNKPFHLRIVVLNDIFTVKQKKYDIENVSSKNKSINTLNPLSDLRPNHWRRRVIARIEPRGRWYRINRLTNKVSDTEISVDVSTHRQLSRAIDNGKTIKIIATTRERDHYLGHSIGNFCCVRINEPGTDAEVQETILQTFTHEIGHGFQQVVRRERTYRSNGSYHKMEKNSKWHNDRHGGQGDHCHTNAKLVDAEPEGYETSSGKVYIHDAGTLCTMFFSGESHVDADGKFCANCVERLRRVKLNATKMRSKGWGWY